MAVRTRKEPMASFTDRESAIKALGSLFDGTRITCGGMYLLQIINTLIEDGKNIFERCPQEILGGLPEGGRRNVQASVICRAKGDADAPQQETLLESGYTPIQEIIGQWAERDGCWSDTPEADLTARDKRHREEIDGSESRIFFDGGSKVYKTIDFLRYPTMARFLDRVAIHNAYFPEAPMVIEGFGMRDYADDNTGFCAVVSQPFVTGTVPTEEQITGSLLARGLVLPGHGAPFYFESPSRDTMITDLHDNNCVLTEEGHVIFFDCEAMINDIPGFGGTFKIPDLRYNPDSVRVILNEINRSLPLEVPKEDLISTLSRETAKEIRVEIDSCGRLNGPVPEGRYAGMLVQASPDNPRTMIVQSPRSLRFLMSFGTLRPEDGAAPFSDNEKTELSLGKAVSRKGRWYAMDLDKGRPVEVYRNPLRLRQALNTSVRI